MRTVYRKLLRSKFSHLLKGLEPNFNEFKDGSPVLTSSEMPYVAKVSARLWLFVVLVIDPKGKQAFTLEFGWSKLERFPEVSPRKCLDLEINRARFNEDEYIQRVRIFLGRDTWWYLEAETEWQSHFIAKEVSSDEAVSRVDVALSDAMAVMREHVMPFFSECVAAVIH